MTEDEEARIDASEKSAEDEPEQDPKIADQAWLAEEKRKLAAREAWLIEQDRKLAEHENRLAEEARKLAAGDEWLDEEITKLEAERRKERGDQA